MTTTNPLPVITPVARRPCQANIPQTKTEREAVRRVAARVLADGDFVPPVNDEKLRNASSDVIQRLGLPELFRDFASVMVSNELWRERFAAVPYDRRLLLLPKCLRVHERCTAEFDELGLLCKRCGLCSLQDLQDEAEKLGYVVLIAEGSPIVLSIIETGQIEAILGVACLNVFERAYPKMEAAAIPGLAIPLLQDDCIDTQVDLDWVWDAIHLHTDDRTRRMDLAGLKDQVEALFSEQHLDEIMGRADDVTERLGREWLLRAGKRWRPFLTAAMHQALQDEPTCPVPAAVFQVAVGIECFHKASLIHDDIEDDDQTRYGEPALHETEGLPVALNVGDYLLGEGYRLIAEADVPAERRVAVLAEAARGHRLLSLGQGAELSWARAPKPMKADEIIEIYRRKTAPAFGVALRAGALLAGEPDGLGDVLQTYSDALGIAYQIRDDLEDLAPGSVSDVCAGRPTVPLALAAGSVKHRAFVRGLWGRKLEPGGSDEARLREAFAKADVPAKTRRLQDGYVRRAVDALEGLDNANLKGFLRRIVAKIFDEQPIQGWCREFIERSEAERKAIAAANRA